MKHLPWELFDAGRPPWAEPGSAPFLQDDGRLLSEVAMEIEQTLRLWPAAKPAFQVMLDNLGALFAETGRGFAQLLESIIGGTTWLRVDDTLPTKLMAPTLPPLNVPPLGQIKIPRGPSGLSGGTP